MTPSTSNPINGRGLVVPFSLTFLGQLVAVTTGKNAVTVQDRDPPATALDIYCEASNVDLSREPNAGNGPVDFKLSTGYQGRILVEIKKSINPDLLHGFEVQLPAYEKSEATSEGIYLIIRVGENESAIKDVLAVREKQVKDGKKVPEVVVVDARKKASASKDRFSFQKESEYRTSFMTDPTGHFNRPGVGPSSSSRQGRHGRMRHGSVRKAGRLAALA